MALPKRPRAFSYVRMSSDAQLDGDSLRRQLEQSRAYAANRGWELLEEDELRDIGISAFSGANITAGALGGFLEAVRSKKVEPGSFLIVESLDRLSRQEALSSFGIFSEIISAGVNIVTLADGKTYCASKTDFTDLMFSIAIMSRAHDESRTKSHRLNAAWKHKRECINELKLTARCPGWLKLSADRKSFSVIADRAQTVKDIFDQSASGIGNYSIARRLNQEGIPTFRNSKNGWCTSSVAKILSSKAAIGEFQPHRIANRKRVPDGDAIQDYFPAIISQELFYRAQNAKSQRRSGGAGRKGQGLSNLFSGLAHCGYCRSTMVFINKGAKPKGGTYLICDGIRRGHDCISTPWRYDDFEASFLRFVEELDLGSIAGSEADTRQRAAVDDEIAATEGRLAALSQEMERLTDLCAKAGSAATFVGQKLHVLANECAELQSSLLLKRQQRDNLQSELGNLYESKEQIKGLLARFHGPNDKDIYKLRSQIAHRLKSLISDISVASVGFAPLIRTHIETLEASGDDEDESTVETLRSLKAKLEDEKEGFRFFTVVFRPGNAARVVYPKKNDPLEFEERVVVDALERERASNNVA